MTVGFAAADRAQRVIGIDASGTPERTEDQVRRIANHTGGLVGLGRDMRADEIVP